MAAFNHTRKKSVPGKFGVRIVIALTVLMTLAVLVVPAENRVFADDTPLELTVEPLFGGQIKENKWFPVKLTISNPGESVSGHIAVVVGKTRGSGDFAALRAVELPAGGSKEIWLALPGKPMFEKTNRVVFYKGDPSKGETIPFSNGTVSIHNSIVPQETLQFGVMASDPDTYNFVRLMDQNGYAVRLHHLDPDEIPSQSFMLEQLDVLALNDFSGDRLEDRQIRAIQGWVRDGGVLILSGGAGYPKTANSFGDLAPVAYEGTASVTDLTALEKRASRELELSVPFTVSTASVRDGGRIWIEQDGFPLFAYREYGNGRVWYAAYDVSLNPLASWNGNAALWQQILQDRLVVSGNGAGNVVRQDLDLWELDNALDYFPQLRPPALGILVLIFFVYIVVVAPLLYLVLKIWDKRGWAWAAIPFFAVLCSLAIYGVGAADRGNVLAQNLNVIELYGDGTGRRVAAAAVFVPRGGDYDVSFASGQTALPFVEKYDAGGGRELEGQVDEWMFQDESGTSRYRFSNVPYWSIRKMWLEDTTVREYGNLDVRLDISGTAIKGEVTNGTSDDLADVQVLFNNQISSVGSLQVGESKSFSLTPNIHSSIHYRNIPQMVFPYRGSRDDKQQERGLLDAALKLETSEMAGNSLVVFGFGQNREHVLNVDGHPVTSNVTNLWMRKADLNYVHDGKISVPYGALKPVMVENSLDHMSMSSYGPSDIGQGEIVFEYVLPGIDDARWEVLHLSFPHAANLKLEIWNEAAGAWEETNPGSTRQTWTGFGEYLIEGRKIRMKVTNSQGIKPFQYPDIALEGEVQP